MRFKFFGLRLTLVEVRRPAAVGRLLTASGVEQVRLRPSLKAAKKYSYRAAVKSETAKLQETLTGEYSPNFPHHLGNTIQ